MRMIEKIKATKKKLHSDEVKHIRNEKVVRKSTRKNFKPGKPKHDKRQKTFDVKSSKGPKKPRTNKMHGKNSIFKEEF